MSGRFRDKVAVVLGGNSGIGLATAKAFANEGARLVITGRQAHTLRTAAEQIGRDVLALCSDISDSQQTGALFEQLATRFGAINVLFVNAGVGAFLPIEAVTEKDWDDIHNVNLKGVFFAIQKALPLLSAGSSIVLTGSIGGRKGFPTASVYAASKAGVRALGRSLAAELVGRGIRVNTVSPGPIETPIINRTAGLAAEAVPQMRQQMIEHSPMKRMGTPEEVAAAVLFLASEQAAYVTGIDFLVDGGIASF